MAKHNTGPGHFSAAIIDDIEPTSDRLTGRAGLTLFVRYLRAIGIYEHLNRLFGSLRKSRKGQPVTEVFKQLLCFFMDGTSRHLTYFDALKQDEGYAGTIESRPKAMLSSHAVKRFFQSFFIVRVWLFRRILQRMFLWRLGLRRPEVILLGVDSMVMDNDEAQKREGVKPTYKKVKGFHPLQITWSRFIVDAVFRGGDKHCNDKETVIKALTHLIEKIRKQYRACVPIIVRMDSGFFDEKIMEKLDELEVGYLIAGKLYDDIKGFIEGIDKSFWRRYQNGKQEWSYVEFGDRRGTWKRFRRVVFSRPFYEDRQRLLEFARPDQIIYTNLGLGDAFDEQLRQAGLGDCLSSESILEHYHGRGSDELVHRALKDFSSQTLPFERFECNAAFYYTMLLGFFLYECFKEDVCLPVVPLAAYATTLRRRILDVAGKIVSHAGRVILKVTQATWNQLQILRLWKRSTDPPGFARL